MALYSGGESFYAVIIICSILLLTFIICVGIRYLRRKRQGVQDESSLNDWQPLRSIATPLDATDIETLKTVSSKFHK